MSEATLESIARRLDLLSTQVNWHPEVQCPCTACKSHHWPPVSGSYGSCLEHFESILGPMPDSRSRVRLLILFQDPRRGEKNFDIASPTLKPTAIEQKHRYFCLTPKAWQALQLNKMTGSPTPVWPTPVTASAYLRRYLGLSKCWSYDGFLAYFIYLFRCEAAYVTNVAKCFFSIEGVNKVASTCANHILSQEVAIFDPNFVISFTSKSPRLAIPSIRLKHPAARGQRKTKISQFVEELRRTDVSRVLDKLGIDAQAIQNRWKVDAEIAIKGQFLKRN